MDITVIELANSVVSCFDIQTSASFVTQTPEDNTRMVAVAERITYVTVNDSTCPIRVIDDCLWTFPVLMKFHISLSHNVKTKVIEHCHHLCMTWIVAGTNRIHIGFLHHCDVT